jgi:hypothetical protein
MAVPTQIYNASRICSGAVAASTIIKRGQLVAYASGLILADASVAVNAPCKGIALQHGDAGEVIKYAQCATLYDADAPWTANTTQYMSPTAGALTETLPATGGDMIQVCGVSSTDSYVQLDIQNPRILNLYFPINAYDTTGEPGLGVVESGWAGPDIDGAAEDVYMLGRFPSNMSALLQARVLVNSAALTATDTDWDVVGAYDGGANDEDTGTAVTAADLTYVANDKIGYYDATAVMDAGFALPGRNFCFRAGTDGVTSGTMSMIGMHIICLVV